MIIQQQDYDIIQQRIINRYLKVNLLDFDYTVVDELSGNVMSFDVSVDADSDIRRTCNVEIVVTDSSFDIKAGSKIWLDKMIQPYIGIENIRTGEIQWYNQGIYLINDPSWQYDAATNTLSFSAVDLMAKLTGLRNGALTGVPYVIPQGSSVREAIITCLGLAGFTKYVVEDCKRRDGVVQPVPYEIKIEQGGTVYDILTALRDILPQYQMYFDVDGVFHYEYIPTGEDAPVLLDDNVLPKIVQSESINTSFESVKNYIEVWGRNHDIVNYPSEITIDGGAITVKIADLPELPANTMIGFTPNADITDTAITIKVVSNKVDGSEVTHDALPLVDSSGEPIKNLAKDVYWVANLQEETTGEGDAAVTTKSWLFMGHQQAQAVWQDDNPDSPFYTGGSVGIIREVLYGGDYDNITSDELALERAKLEIYWKCRLNDTLSMGMLPIPWLDVNTVIEHAVKGGTTTERYMIKSFSADYGDINGMDVNAMTLYPYYPPY